MDKKLVRQALKEYTAREVPAQPDLWPAIRAQIWRVRLHHTIQLGMAVASLCLVLGVAGYLLWIVLGTRLPAGGHLQGGVSPSTPTVTPALRQPVMPLAPPTPPAQRDGLYRSTAPGTPFELTYPPTWELWDEVFPSGQVTIVGRPPLADDTSAQVALDLLDLTAPGQTHSVSELIGYTQMPEMQILTETTRSITGIAARERCVTYPQAVQHPVECVTGIQVGAYAYLFRYHAETRHEFLQSHAGYEQIVTSFHFLPADAARTPLPATQPTRVRIGSTPVTSPTTVVLQLPVIDLTGPVRLPGSGEHFDPPSMPSTITREQVIAIAQRGVSCGDRSQITAIAIRYGSYTNNDMVLPPDSTVRPPWLPKAITKFDHYPAWVVRYTGASRVVYRSADGPREHMPVECGILIDANGGHVMMGWEIAMPDPTAPTPAATRADVHPPAAPPGASMPAPTASPHP